MISVRLLILLATCLLVHSYAASTLAAHSALVDIIDELGINTNVVGQLENMGLNDAFLIGEAAIDDLDVVQSMLEKASLLPGEALRLALACRTALKQQQQPIHKGVGDDQTVGVRTFGTVLCNGSLVSGTEEVLVYQYTVSSTAASAAITHWQFTSNGPAEPWTVRFYIDGETVASLKFNFWMEGRCNSCGWGLLLDPNSSWGVSKMGKGSAWGGLYNNMRVPFNKQVIITVQGDHAANFFSILRGAENVPVMAGGLVLPPSARLHIYAQEDYSVPGLGFLPVLNSTSSGILAMWTMVIFAPNLNFLEACTRVWIDGQPMYFIGDGEDFFDSAWYFNGGTYTFPQAGLTYICTGSAGAPNIPPCADKTNAIVSAYRIFDDDPIVWHNSANITWRNGETSPEPGVKCMYGNEGGPAIGNPGTASIFSYAWVYEW